MDFFMTVVAERAGPDCALEVRLDFMLSVGRSVLECCLARTT